MLEVRLIGRFDIQCDGKPVAIPSRNAQSLFAYLILTAGISHRREKLAGIFWPDVPEEKARGHLRHELWRIRRVLPKKSKIEYLIATDVNICFNASAEYWLDVGVLENGIDDPSIQELINAVSVFDGELLPGFYDDWITQEREYVQSLYEQRIARLLELLEGKKCWNDMLQWAEHWIAHGQGPEAAFRFLMGAYDALGDRAKVASTYERCVKALQESGLEPSEETRALAFKRSSALNVPIPLTSFIGREKELKEVTELLSKSRLVTLTGSGGVGKTRLAIQVVAEVLDRFPDGVWFLDLAPLSDPALVPNTLAKLLGLHEYGELPVTDLLINYFRARTALILFDNCEHLIEACAQLINSLLTSSTGLSILATSREPLRISGEIPYRVPSLEIPKLEMESNMDMLLGTESVRLFMERAETVSPGFEIVPQNASTIAQICKRLDGIPLAIELAAARINMLPLQQILTRLDDRFNLLTRGLRTVLPRHQTLRATVGWSYDLLSEQERVLFRRLAVFAGGWTLEAVENVCIGNGIETAKILDLLSELVNKSLVAVEITDEETRYHMLETIRQYAQERSAEADESNMLRDRHLNNFRALAEQAKPQLRGSHQLMWLDRLDTEYDNIRAALTWSLEGGSVEAGIGLAADLAIGGFWNDRDHRLEGLDFLEKLLSKPQLTDRIQALAKGHLAATIVTSRPLTLLNAYRHAEQSESLWLQLGPACKADLAYARNWKLFLYIELNFDKADFDPGRVRQGYEENLKLFQEVGDRWMSALTHSCIGMELLRSGDFVSARQEYVQSLELFRECGDNLWVGVMNRFLGNLALEEGNYAEARTRFEENISILRQMRSNSVDLLWMLGTLAIREGDYTSAKAWYSECLLLDLRLGVATLIPECLIGFARIANAEKRFVRAAQLVGALKAEAESRQVPLENFDRAELQRLTAVLHEELGDSKLEDLMAEGRAMTTKQVVAYVLEKNE